MSLHMENMVAYKYRTMAMGKRDISIVRHHLINFYSQIVKFGRGEVLQETTDMP